MRRNRLSFITCALILLVIGASLVHRASATTVGQAFGYQVYLPILAKPFPPGVHILPNDYYYVDSFGYLHVLGEVFNNTASQLQLIKITVNFFNGSGHFVDTASTWMWLGTLPPYSKTCFEHQLPEPLEWSYYSFETPTYWTDNVSLPNLTVLDDSGSYNSDFGWYRIIGLVRNDDERRVEGVQTIATLYNIFGKVIGCGFTYVNSIDLDPGQISSFDLIVSGRDYSDEASYQLQVDGNPQ